MAKKSRPRVELVDYATEFLELLSRSDARSITLIVCGTKDVFIQDLLTTFQWLAIQHPETSDAEIEHNDANATTSGNKPGQQHHLLANTIGLVASSKRTKLAFCDSLQHLRAYISAFQIPPTYKMPDSSRFQGQPILAILNPVALHCPTSEFSAQGLSQTFALAVEVSARQGADLVICECKVPGAIEDVVSGQSLWSLSIPLLSSTVGAVSDERSRAARTVKVEQVAKRWFEFHV